MDNSTLSKKKLAVFGSRSLTDARVSALIGEYYSKLSPSIIVTSEEPAGVCKLAQNFAKKMSLGLELHFLNPEYGRGAFEHRSDDIINSSDVVLLIHDGKSKGTANELARVKKFKKEFYYEILGQINVNTEDDTEDVSISKEIVSGWNPLTGKRVFKSAHEAWQIYGQYRFAVSARTFQTYVGKHKACAPRPDGKLYVEDIEMLAKAEAWAPAPSFVWGAQKGGEGEVSKEELEIGAKMQLEKLKGMEMDNEERRIKLGKELRELLPVKEYEQRLAAAAAIVGTEAETFVYDNVREIIHLCDGKPEKENSLREYLLGKVKVWLNAFSRSVDYEVTFEEESAEGGLTDERASDID
jgi:hypothetical protein